MSLDTLSGKNWKHYLTRPFSLFEASIWHEWYKSDLVHQLVGVKLNNALYIEYPLGNVRHYRYAQEIETFISAAESLAKDKEKATHILRKGLELNNMAETALTENTFVDVFEAIDFLISVALYAGVLPYFIGQYKELDDDTMELVKKLRSVSYYPKILDTIIMPLARKELSALGSFDPELIYVITLQELISKKIDPHRLKEKKNGTTFVLEIDGSKESVNWVRNSEEIVNKIEHIDIVPVTQVRGLVACRGNAKGVVRLIGNNASNAIFNLGDILISQSTNPNLLPLMQKAGAIVTDEGGITSHAAIISRELNVPCVIGTKNATRVFKDGDEVEVDAVSGIVSKLIL